MVIDMVKPINKRQHIVKDSEMLFIKKKNSVYKLPIGQVLFFKSDLHKITAQMQDGNVEFLYSINQLQQDLIAHNFFRCSNSCLVSLNYISGIQGNNAIVANYNVKISRGKKKELLNAFFSHNNL